MTLIKNAEEFKKIYPYKSTLNKDDYPKTYPCFCEVENYDGGIGGDYMTVAIVYPPHGCDLKSFKLGLEARNGQS